MNAKSGILSWIAPIFIVIVVLLSFSKIMFHENYVLVEGQDLTGQAYPWFNVAAHWFQNKTLLFWDPYVYSGKPNTGEPQTGIFYPINWIFFAWHFKDGQLPTVALETLIILNFCLMSVFVYFLARSFGISRKGAVISGIVGGLGGLNSKMHSWLNIQSSFVWLPLILLFYNKANKSPSRKSAFAFLLLCAVCLAVSFLAGHHQPPIQAAILLGMYALYLKVSKQYSRDHVPFLVGLFVIASIATLLAAIQIFPSAEWGTLAYRWAGSYGPLQGGEKIPHYVLENVEKVHPQDFLSILFPYATTMVNLYVGPMVVILAFLGAMFSQKRESKFFLIAAILFVLFSLGKYSILHTWLYTYVPGMWFAREGIYFLLPFLICIALLAGYGLDALSEESINPANVSIQKIAGALAKLLVIVLAILIAICIGAVLQDQSFLKDSRISKAAGLMLYLILICLLFIFVYYRKISAPVFQTLIVAMIVIDLSSEISRAIPLRVSDEGEAFTPANVYQKNEVAKTVKDYQFHERFRVDDLSDILPPNAGDAWLIYSTRGYTTTMDQHYYDLRASGWGQFSNPSALLNTSYFISPVTLDFADSIWNQDEIGIYRNPRAVPEAFSVTQAKIFSDKEELLKFMNSPLFNPHSTGLFLQEDWGRIPADWQKKITSHTIDIDLARLDYVKAKALNHPNPEIQHLYSKPWGWDSGDAINGVFRLATDTDVKVLLNYFAGETDCSLPFVLRNSKQIKNEQVELRADSNKNLIGTQLHLGKLGSDNYQFQLEIPENCNSKLDSLEIVTAISESSDAGEVKVLSYKPHSITISTSSKKPSLLLLSEVSYPGWIAKIDGREIPIYRVNYALRAVAVDAGKHRIEFHFRPASIYAGFGVTFLSLAGVVIYLWFQRKHLLSQ